MGGSLMNTPSIAAVGHWFCKRRGLAVGITTSAGSIGGIIFPLMLKVTLDRYGFAWSMRILGFILLLLALPPNLLIRTRLPRSQKFTSVWPDVRVFLDSKFALCCCGIFLMEYGVLIPLTYIISYASTHGHNATQAYILPALLNTGSVVGRVIPGLVSDRLGRFNTMIITVGGCAVAVLALWLPNGKSEPMLISFTIILGFVSGGNVSLTPVCIGQLCDSRDYGRYLSGAMLVAGFGTLTGIPIGGAILGNQSSKGWLGLILFSSLSYVVSVCCFIAARVLAVGWSLRVVY
jgi:MFS family permease